MQRAKKIIIVVIVLGILIVLALFIARPSTDQQGGGISFPSFFPFGGTVDREPTTGPDGTSQPPDRSRPGVEDSRESLVQLTDYSVAGFSVVNEVTVDEVAGATIRVVHAENGTINDIIIQNSNILGRETVSGTVIPDIREAIVIDQHTILRYIETEDGTDVVRTYLGKIISSTSLVRSLDGIFLPDNITEIIPGRTNDEIIYVLEDSSGVVGIFSYTIPTEETVRLAQTPLHEINLHVIGEDLYVSTKPTAYQEGYFFIVRDGTLISDPAIEPTAGLSGLPTTAGTSLLLGVGSRNSMGIMLYTPETASVLRLNVPTLSDKCTIPTDSYITCAVPLSIPSGIYPDHWYQDRVVFTDKFQTIVFQNGGQVRNTNDLYNPLSEDGYRFDAYKLATIENQSILLFVDRNDGTLWMLR